MIDTMTDTRQDTIDKIVAAARRPCPRIVEAIRYVDPETQSEYLWNGVPFGVDSRKLVRTVVGYVYSDGATTYGTRYDSRDAAELSHNQWEDKTGAEFRVKLNAMSAAKLAEQAAYWLK